MLLKEFQAQFGALPDEDFLAHFVRPFLLEEGQVLEEDGGATSRQIFYLNGEEDEALVLGRAESADICIRHPNLSKRHATLQPPGTTLPDWSITDLGSTNGTYADGKRLTPHDPHALSDQVVLGLGPGMLFVFLQPLSLLTLLRKGGARSKPAPAQPASMFGQTMIDGRLALGEETSIDIEEREPDEPPPPPPPAPEKRAAHRHESGRFLRSGVQGELLIHCEPFEPVSLEVGQPLVLGRTGAHATMVLPHPLVSRRHAEIIRHRDGSVTIRDLGSANGTYVGGTRLGTDPVELLPGQVIRIVDFRIVLKAPQKEETGSQTIVAGPSQRAKGLQASLSKMPLSDLLQGIEEKQKSGALEVVARDVRGRITFKAGLPHQAMTDSGATGVAAIQELMALQEGNVTIYPGAPVSGEREVSLSFTEIMLEDFLTRE